MAQEVLEISSGYVCNFFITAFEGTRDKAFIPLQIRALSTVRIMPQPDKAF